MKVHLLGTAAGGAFPQWNCACANCRTARHDPAGAVPRTQSCAAVSADGRRWFLLNASPDVRAQIESFPPLQPGPPASAALPPAPAVRGSNVCGVLLTNADLDHTLGLFVLREGGRLAVHAPPPVRRALVEGLNLADVLGRYCGVEWLEPPARLAPLRCADGTDSGLDYAAFPVPGKPPRYRPRAAPQSGDAVGYRLVDRTTAGRLVYVPDLARIDEAVLQHLRHCDALLIDGTFWSDDEMIASGAGPGRAADMGHLHVGGPAGSLRVLEALPAQRRVYVHLNNTNPMLREDSPERRAVEAAGAVVAWDGMEFDI